MASIRKVKKIRAKAVKKITDKIDTYKIPFTYTFGGGYFIFSFDADEFNMHVKFPSVPNMLFGIWKFGTEDGKPRYQFFAEHVAYIDKFKPTAVEFVWKSLEEMMDFVMKYSNNELELKKHICEVYEEDSIEELDRYTAEDYYRSRHNGFTQEEYETSLKNFNNLLNTIDVNRIDIIYRKADSFKDLYDVYYYPEAGVSDEELDELDNKLRKDCNCIVFGMRRLPPHYWKHQDKYILRVADYMKIVYTNKKYHERYYRNL